ncbi:MAG: hypothetical protein V1809_10405 [Planctomycetota bacterium]
MLLIRKLAAVVAAAGLLGVWSAAFAADVSEHLEKLGNPLAKRYPDGSKFHYARHISDLQGFDGKLYVGHGDWGDNSGPTDIWYYDLHKKEFVKQGQIQDEAADHYQIINGRLYVPGADPQEDWSLGNFYRLEDGTWVKHRTLPGAIHCFDIVGVDKTLFAIASRLIEQPQCLMVSTDDGKTWKVHEIPADTRLPPDTRLQQQLLVIDGNVYVPGVAKSGGVKVHRFNGKGFDPCTGDMLPGVKKPVRNPKDESWSMLAMEKSTSFKGKAVYLGSVVQSIKDADKPWRSEKASELFVAALSGPNEFRAERSLTGENFTDIAVADEHCYVVSYRWKNKNDPKQGAVTTVSASADLKNWSKLFSFHYETFASAIEMVNGDFYLGLGGTREFCTPSMGMILKVGKDKLK